MYCGCLPDCKYILQNNMNRYYNIAVINFNMKLKLTKNLIVVTCPGLKLMVYNYIVQI